MCVGLLGPCFKTGEQSPYNNLKSHVRHEQMSLGIRGSGKPSHTYRPKAFKCLPQQFPLLAAPAQAQLLQTQPNAFIFIKTPRNPQQLHEQEPYATNRLCPLLLAVSSTFNSLFKVLFTFPSRYLFTIGHQRVFSLIPWSGRVHAKFHVHRVTQGTARVLSVFGYGPFTLWGAAFHPLRLTVRIPYRSPTTPGSKPPGLGSSAFARHY